MTIGVGKNADGQAEKRDSHGGCQMSRSQPQGDSGDRKEKRKRKNGAGRREKKTWFLESRSTDSGVQ
jgi:hypothetical protein